MTTLLDGNLLIALSVPDHVHHAAAILWLDSTKDQVASCPITQGTLVRLLLQQGRGITTAMETLSRITDHSRHVFWPDDISFQVVRTDSLIGHRQVTDAYLAQLAREHQGRLATFDFGLADLHRDVIDLVPQDNFELVIVCRTGQSVRPRRSWPPGKTGASSAQTKTP